MHTELTLFLASIGPLSNLANPSRTLLTRSEGPLGFCLKKFMGNVESERVSLRMFCSTQAVQLQETYSGVRDVGKLKTRKYSGTRGSVRSPDFLESECQAARKHERAAKQTNT